MDVAFAFAVLLGLVIGNFLWQLAFGRDWWRAFERSYFQAVAVAVCLLAAAR